MCVLRSSVARKEKKMAKTLHVKESLRSLVYHGVEPLEAIAKDVGIPVNQLVKVATHISLFFQSFFNDD